MMASQARGRSGEPSTSSTAENENASTKPPSNDTKNGESSERDHSTDIRNQGQSRSHENIERVFKSGMGSSSGEGRMERDTESSADEETNIMRRSSRNHMSYQGTSTNPSSAAAAGAKKGRKPARREEENEEDEASEGQGWWAQMLSKYGSIELENKGSVARDHLALERTFLAWLRTSLAFASIGIAITQLFRLNVSSSSSSETDRYAQLRSMGKPLGATFLGISIVMLFIGFHRYFESQHWIIRGKFPASRGSIMIVAMVTFALMVTSLIVVVVVEPGVREK